MPFASANVKTRGESVFTARNAIDGNTENRLHAKVRSTACFRTQKARNHPAENKPPDER
jgi:hypothetical protein